MIDDDIGGRMVGPRLLLRLSAGLVLVAVPSFAQFDVPKPKPLTGEQQFQRQCGTCHTLKASEPQRQGPTLDHVYGRKAGAVKGYNYSSGFAKADWVWDEKHLDAWLTNPQAVIPGAVMPYRQAKPDIRAAVIGYLKDQKQ